LSSGMVDQPSDSLIRPIPQVDHGGDDHDLEMPGDPAVLGHRLAALGARPVLGELAVVDHPVARFAPGHGQAPPGAGEPAEATGPGTTFTSAGGPGTSPGSGRSRSARATCARRSAGRGQTDAGWRTT